MRPRGSGRFSPLPASQPPKGRRPPIPPSLLPALRLSWPPFLWVSPSFGRAFSWLLFLRISSTTSFSLSFLLLSSFSFSLPLSYLFSSLPWLASIKSYETTNPPVGRGLFNLRGLPRRIEFLSSPADSTEAEGAYSQLSAPPVWYSITRVSTKFLSFLRSVISLIQGNGLLAPRSEEHTSELQSLAYLVCRLLLEKKKN